LHRFRVAGKRARYIAEMAGQNPAAVRLVQELNQLQDAIGDWHDWVQLAGRAETLFGGAQDSALVAVLRNVTRAKFRQAVHTLTETRARLAGKKPVAVTTLGRRPLRDRSAAAVA
jgi:CHAD domain-containing protein